MNDRTQHSDADARDLDLLVVGATGVTGRCVLRHLADLDRRGHGGLRWAAAGRDAGRVRAALTAAGAPDVAVVRAELGDPSTLPALARRTALVLNLAGPYSATAEGLIDACVAAGTSYVDVSGEIPLLRRVIDRFDAPARAAGVAVVQMAGWEAVPADTTTLLACARALRQAPDALPQHPDGPGAGEGIDSVHVSVDFPRTPAHGGGGISDSVSAGTIASITAQLADPDARLIGDTNALLPATSPTRTAPERGPLQLRPHRFRGRLFGPMTPVAFLNPPIVRRSAALLAQERQHPVSHAGYREGTDLGPATGPATIPLVLRATASAALQRTLLAVTTAPLTARRVLTGQLDRIAPAPGSGPTGDHPEDWAWRVHARARTTTGHEADATLTGTGHPGYAATASMAVAVATHVLRRTTGRTGCITPALALGIDGCAQLDAAELHMHQVA